MKYLQLTPSGVNHLLNSLQSLDLAWDILPAVVDVEERAAAYSEPLVLEHGFSYETGRRTVQGYIECIEFGAAHFRMAD